MISNHAQFLAAIREKNLVRIVYYSQPEASTVDRECAPLDYGPEWGASDRLYRYWVWDYADHSGNNPLGLLPGQIVQVHVLGTTFDPGTLGIPARPWFVMRDWGTPVVSAGSNGGAHGARAVR